VRHRPDAGFTLVEVLVALVVVAIGLAALMVAVSGTARTSGYLRDKTLAQWIALNRIAEVRLTVNKLAQSTSTTSSSTTSGATSGASGGDAGELQFAGRTWHYDTRY
jgi:general secretion pathway protein I